MLSRENVISGNLECWKLYAENEEGMSEQEAELEWYNHHNIGKYLICEAREDNATRLFIRSVPNTLQDVLTKGGWWNVFTVTNKPVAKGMWLAKVIKYRLDRNNYLNLKVETLLPVDNIKFNNLFSQSSDNGTWNSIAWWLMMSCSNMFLKEYAFERYTCEYKPNFDELVKHYPEFKEMSHMEIGKRVLLKYLHNEITLWEIENCLNEPTDWEKFILGLQKEVACHHIEKLYGEKYPIFSSKVYQNVIKDGYVNLLDLEAYLQRQLNYYYELERELKIEKVDGEYLDKIEAALAYRKALKDNDKKLKKERRKEKHDNCIECS